MTDAAWSGRFTCREEVGEYLGGETVHCLICWKEGIKVLGPHLLKAHGVKNDAYCVRFGIAIGTVLAGSAHRRTLAIAHRKLQDDEEPWNMLLERLASGERLTAIFRKPGLPQESMIRRRKQQDPIFRAAYMKALEGRRGAPLTPETMKRRTDAIVATLSSGESLQGAKRVLPNVLSDLRLLGRHGGENAERLRGLIKPSTREISKLNQERVDWGAFERRIAAGERLGQLIGSSPDMPHDSRVWRRRSLVDPALAARLAPMMSRHRFRPASGNIRGNTAAEEFRRALGQNELYAAIDAVVPRRLDPTMRDDIRGDLILAVLSGSIRLEDVRGAVPGFITAYGREYLRRDQSIDAPMGESGMTLGGLIADPGAFDASEMNVRIVQPSHLF